MSILQGPKLRLGNFKNDWAEIDTGQSFILDSDPAPGDSTRVHLPHPEIFAAIKPGDALLIDDGKLRLIVTEVEPQRIVARVKVGGKVSNRKGVSLPETVVPVAALASKDIADLEAALEAGIDWVALSFIQRPEDVAEAKKITRGRAAVMAKIEKPQAVSRLNDILDLADGLMVARGDLGVEMPLEKVPGVQKEMTRACRRAGKPVIVATQMLESMIASPVPTRAEVSDVATAIFDGADAVMLSAESASGQYPVEAVATMNRIAEEVESNDDMYLPSLHVLRTEPEATGADAIAAAARQIAETLDLAAIVCWTSSGSTGMRVSRERPKPPIVAISPMVATGRKLSLGLGRPLRRCRGRARSGRHGRARLPDRVQGRLRQGRPARHHRCRRSIRNARRHQHDPGCFRRRESRRRGVTLFGHRLSRDFLNRGGDSIGGVVVQHVAEARQHSTISRLARQRQVSRRAATAARSDRHRRRARWSARPAWRNARPASPEIIRGADIGPVGQQRYRP